MDNNKTVTMKMSAPIVTPDGSYELSFRVSVRSGATDVMIAETVAHWLHAAQRLANGELGCTNEFQERSEYELSEHGQNRVVIFGDMQVFTKSGLRLFPVNVFCETTSAQDFVTFTWGVMGGMGLVSKLPQSIKFAGAIKAQQKPKSELDNHFGERKSQAQTPQKQASQQQQIPPQRTDHHPTDPNDTPRLGGYNYKLKADYKNEYGGQTVRFDVLKMNRIFDERDGSALVQVYSSYNGGLSKYPAHDLKIKPNRLEKVDDYTRMILQAVLDGEENNSAHEGSYYMFVNDEGKMYPVLSKLSLKGKSSHEGRDEDDYYMSPGEYDGDSIPF